MRHLKEGRISGTIKCQARRWRPQAEVQVSAPTSSATRPEMGPIKMQSQWPVLRGKQPHKQVALMAFVAFLSFVQKGECLKGSSGPNLNRKEQRQI